MKKSLKRIDAHLSSLGYCSRSEAKHFLRRFEVCVDGVRVFDVSKKVPHDAVRIEGEPLDPEQLLILMHKPSGVICSHDDAGVLIYSLLPERFGRRNPKLATVGRLDADTTGAILLTDNGTLNHQLSSPKSDVTKVYEVTLAQALRGDEAALFASGTLMLKGESKPLLPAHMEVLFATQVRLEISEGKYHQVKRMFGAVGNKVVALHRVRFGAYDVEDLGLGEYRVLDFGV